MATRSALPTALALASLVLAGAIFGFFYAWVCSTIWGLDAADPRVAIPAMQAMNASVRNAVFAPAFFLTPVVLAATALAVRRAGRAGALAFGLAALVYVAGAFLPTMLVSVPMNEALALVAVPADEAAARTIWADYSPRWQAWNAGRTVACVVSLVLVGWGLLRMGAGSVQARIGWRARRADEAP